MAVNQQLIDTMSESLKIMGELGSLSAVLSLFARGASLRVGMAQAGPDLPCGVLLEELLLDSLWLSCFAQAVAEADTWSAQRRVACELFHKRGMWAINRAKENIAQQETVQ